MLKMNNVVNNQNRYPGIRNNDHMCYDNKGMVSAVPSTRQANQVSINISDTNQQAQSNQTSTSNRKSRCRLRFRRTQIINAIVFVIVIPLLYLLEYGYIPGYKLGFRCNDPNISHKFRGDTISPIVLLVTSLLMPLLVILLVEIMINRSIKKVKIGEFWLYYKECLIGTTVVLLVTEIIKIFIGEPRPHFLEVCGPKENENCQNGTYIYSYTCTNPTGYKSYFVIDTARSFPSGHSSISVFVALYCAYVVQTRLSAELTGRLFKLLMVTLCLVWGFYCSLSRILDHRHHWWDVLAGMTLGSLFAIYSLNILHKKLKQKGVDNVPRMSTSTTTLLDVKNKDATSVII